MKISPTDLDLVWQVLREKLLSIDEIDMDGLDQYWTVIPGDAMKFDVCPEPGVGSLADDWETLRRLIKEPDTALFNDLTPFASVISLISERIIPSDDSDEQ